MKDRAGIIMRASGLGIGLNLGLTVVKAVVGIYAGSVSVLTDAVNNLMDILSSVVTLLGVKLAKRKPDREHPQGHGRIEYLAAIGVGLIILGVGVAAVLTSVPKIMEPVIARYSTLSIVVIFTTVMVKWVFSRYLRQKGKETRSRSLEASGIDAMFDAILTLGTLVGAVVSVVFGVSVDGWIGLVIAAFIIRSAIEILGEGIGDLIGRKVDDRLARKIRETVKAVEGVEGVKGMMLHDYGPEDVSGVVKIVVNEEMKMKTFRKICTEIENRVRDEFDVEIVVGV